jgi:hypothetical protein
LEKPHYKTYDKTLSEWQEGWKPYYNVAVSINIAAFVAPQHKHKHGLNYSHYISYKFLNHFDERQREYVIQVFKRTSHINMSLKELTMLLKNDNIDSSVVDKIVNQYSYEKVLKTLHVPFEWTEKILN